MITVLSLVFGGTAFASFFPVAIDAGWSSKSVIGGHISSVGNVVNSAGNVVGYTVANAAQSITKAVDYSANAANTVGLVGNAVESYYQPDWQFQRELFEFKEEYENDKTVLEEEKTKALAQIEKEEKEAIEAIEEQFQAQEQEIQGQIAEIDQEEEETIAAIEGPFKEKEQEFKDQIETLKDEEKEILSLLRKGFLTELKEAIKNGEWSKLISIIGEYLAARKEVKEEYIQEIKEVEDQLVGLDEERQEVQKAVDEAKKGFAETRKELEEQLAALEEENEKAVEALKETFQEERDEINEEYEEKFAGLLKNYEDKATELWKKYHVNQPVPDWVLNPESPNETIPGVPYIPKPQYYIPEPPKPFSFPSIINYQDKEFSLIGKAGKNDEYTVYESEDGSRVSFDQHGKEVGSLDTAANLMALLKDDGSQSFINTKTGETWNVTINNGKADVNYVTYMGPGDAETTYSSIGRSKPLRQNANDPLSR